MGTTQQGKCKSGKNIRLTKEGYTAHRRRVEKCGVFIQVTAFFANALAWVCEIE